MVPSGLLAKRLVTSCAFVISCHDRPSANRLARQCSPVLRYKKINLLYKQALCEFKAKTYSRIWNLVIGKVLQNDKSLRITRLIFSVRRIYYTKRAVILHWLTIVRRIKTRGSVSAAKKTA